MPRHPGLRSPQQPGQPGQPGAPGQPGQPNEPGEPGEPGKPRLLWLTDLFDPLTGFMDAFHECVCREFALAGRPVCDCAQYGGESPPPADDCACDCLVTVVHPDSGDEVEMRARGQAWVRLVQVPGESYNRRSSSSAGTSSGWGGCVSGQPFRVIVEAGVYRCVSTPADDGQPPGEQQRTSDARELHRDVAVLWRIWECCEVLRTYGSSPELDRIEPLGPSGGCVGATMRLWLSIDTPEPEPEVLRWD